ncbi:hypothetical protein [Mechercharimyces sp. CAU 1602]|uniref:hypothetical protein n=1 Tax=Mechercharimyces sp. CAU 1602 TaxID=2973933 RepID=UPI0021635B0B|nr:hypothetical protein [Mechercharimyces sp. CAU 1602]MCS1350237.1 hypothetical protein [Mechercharimyces sp. CAU 1602]
MNKKKALHEGELQDGKVTHDNLSAEAMEEAQESATQAIQDSMEQAGPARPQESQRRNRS